MLPVSALEYDMLNACLGCMGLSLYDFLCLVEGRNCLLGRVSKEALLIGIVGLRMGLRLVFRRMQREFIFKGQHRIDLLTTDETD